MTKNLPSQQPENRERREAAALRDNLLKRKLQQRERQAGDAKSQNSDHIKGAE